MPKGILLVESFPESAGSVELYHTWYNETHLREIVGLEGFSSARRFELIGEDGPFVAIYEIEADDLEKARLSLSEAVASGRLTMPQGLQRDPTPVVRWLKEIAAYPSLCRRQRPASLDSVGRATTMRIVNACSVKRYTSLLTVRSARPGAAARHRGLAALACRRRAARRREGP
jgi:hypothetical protein